MKIFVCINTDISYQRILDRIGNDHKISVNLKTLEQFAEAMSMGVPDIIIVDKNLSYLQNALQLQESLPIIVFEGSFPSLMDQLSDFMMSSESNPVKTSSHQKHQEILPIDRLTDSSLEKLDVASTSNVGHPDPEEGLTRTHEEMRSTDSDATQGSDGHDDAERPQEHIQPLGTLRTEWIETRALLVNSEQNPKLQQLIGVWGAAGGIGKTEIAKNLALYLGRRCHVALLDFNLVNPDIGDHLGIGFPQGRTLYDAYEAYLNQDLTASRLERMMVDYHGIKVLAGLPDAITQSDLSVLFFTLLIKTIRSAFDVVIVDMDHDLTGAAGIQVLSYCNRIIMPLTTSSSVLGHTKVYLNLLRQGKIEPEKIDFVLNRQGEGGEVTEQKMVEVLGKKPIATIRYDHKFLTSVDRARPLILQDHRQLQKAMELIGKPYFQAIEKFSADQESAGKQDQSHKRGSVFNFKNLNSLYRWGDR